MTAEAARLAAVDNDHYGLVAIDASRQAIAAQAEYIRTGPTTAEVAFATVDARRGVGLATLMLARLASVAFLVAIVGVWGFVVPPTWWQPLVLFAAAPSAVLFTIYFSPRAILPLVVDAIAVWLVLSQGDALTQLATP